MEESKFDYLLNEASEVIEPPLHDAKLYSICTENEIIKLGFTLADREQVYCSLINVKQFTCNNFKQGNIVLDLTLYKGEALNENIKDKLFSKPIGYNNKFERYIESVNCKLINNELILVVLNPSYGAEIISICEDIKFSERL
jgi:hypothetical protein